MRSGIRCKACRDAVCSARRAFTLTEILVVIGIIVLLIAVAVPTLSSLTGGKSIEGAQNQLSAALGRARAEAIGVQKRTGVMLFLDPATQRRSFAIVQEVDPPSALASSFTRDVWLDLADDAEFIPLPVGIGMQFVDDAVVDITVTPNARSDDGYIGLNKKTHICPSRVTPPVTPMDVTNFDALTPLGGVVLFDANGQLTSKTYGFRCSIGTAAAGDATLTSLGRLIFTATAVPAYPTYAAPEDKASDMPPGLPLKSQFGMLMYEQDAFVNAGWSDTDPQVIDGTNANYKTGSPAESAEEIWLDNNSTPLMINRYTGALVKGE